MVIISVSSALRAKKGPTVYGVGKVVRRPLTNHGVRTASAGEDFGTDEPNSVEGYLDVWNYARRTHSMVFESLVCTENIGRHITGVLMIHAIIVVRPLEGGGYSGLGSNRPWYFVC